MNRAVIKRLQKVADDASLPSRVRQAAAAGVSELEQLADAVRALLPRGWSDGQMDHMPGVKAARTSLGRGPRG